ncbi:MAG: penicillin-binding protein 1C [Bacteroidales bacterium]|nr:penicillin-binding protein 1C [Bacteroidales bacterium]
MTRKLKILTAGGVAILALVLFSPFPRFNDPCSTVVEAADGTLLGARIAGDGQWRFPASDSVPEKFSKAIVTFEDRYFWFHPGVNPVSILRALSENLKAGRIVSGGSTITMQAARLARGNRERTIVSKLSETLSALKLELLRSKKAILAMYAANAPFGGNTVGLEAASLRYTGKPPSELSWAEASTLAVLPNSPSLIYPGKNQEQLKAKRDRLLHKLYKRGYLDSLTLVLSLDEPLPGRPESLPAGAQHLTDWFYSTERGKRVTTTIDANLQRRATEVMRKHQQALSENFIFNSACIIVEVNTGEVKAYVGNSSTEEAPAHGGNVDIIRSSRSTGSILKPILYAAMQQSGAILPMTLVPDIPTRFPGFSPDNFDHSLSGAVSATSALAQSLNIPAVRMLHMYDPERFLELLKLTGFSTLDKPASHYGLSLILGGGETSLWELAGVYASMSRVLNRFNSGEGYSTGDYHPPVLVSPSGRPASSQPEANPPLDAASIWLTWEALQKVNRPESESGWHYFGSSVQLAWKTGTSFGFRDAWALGTTPRYVVAVWAGNADGEGRPGLTGLSAAAPALFDLVSLLEHDEWFSRPQTGLTDITICRQSGYRAGPDCPDTEEATVHINGLRTGMCPYHQIIHLNSDKTRQVNADCYPAEKIVSQPWFILPPAMEYFYRKKHPEYRILPPFEEGCSTGKNITDMEFIYPPEGTRIFIPRDHTGEKTRIIPEIVHRNPQEKIFWHLDSEYRLTTQNIHQVELYADPGRHTITAVDGEGNTISCTFTIEGTLR